jgi:hypothetical protein
MIQNFKNWDRKIAKNYPKVWVLGLHIYLPVIILTWLVFYGLGWMISTDPLPTRSRVNEFSEQLTLYSILPTIVIGILYFIRQIRFNALRVHHHLPFKNPYSHFAAFLLICVLFTSIPQAAHFGLYHRMKTSINEDVFKEDLIHLNNGYTHFYQSDFSRSVFEKYDNIPEVVGVTDSDSGSNLYEYSDGTIASSYKVRGENRIRSTYRLNETQDSLILFRSQVTSSGDYYYYYESDYTGKRSSSGWDTISLAAAADEIQMFASRSPFYKGNLEKVDFSRIVSDHIAYNADQMELEQKHQTNFDKFIDGSRFREIVGTNAQAAFQQRPFRCTKIDFWMWYVFLALYLSVFMFILSSVKLVDFGWALLVGSISAVTYGIINGLSFMDFERPEGFFEVFNLMLLTMYVFIYVGVMFSKRVKNGIKKAFAIAFHVFVPHVILAYFALFDELHECPYHRSYDDVIDPCLNYEYFDRDGYFIVALGVSLLSVAIGIWFFNRYYTRRYVYPDPSR